MATATRQVGRRGLSNTTGATANTTTSRSVLSPSPTSSATAPPRRYVLDVPTGRTIRTSRTTRATDGYDDATIRSRSAGATITYGGTNELSRSGSRDYYYRDGGSESSVTTGTRYFDDPSVKEIFESGTTYTNTIAEDQEVQAITAKATPDVKNYPINVDANPELIVRPNTQRLTYTQDIAVRYMKPSTPPPPGVRSSILILFWFMFFSFSLSSFGKFVHHPHHLLLRLFFVNVRHHLVHHHQ